MTDERSEVDWEKALQAGEFFARSDGLRGLQYGHEKNLFRADLAHWEVAELFRCCMKLAIFDSLRVKDYREFEKLWQGLVGDGGTVWLPSIYLAAVSSPLFSASKRAEAVRSTIPYLT